VGGVERDGGRFSCIDIREAGPELIEKSGRLDGSEVNEEAGEIAASVSFDFTIHIKGEPDMRGVRSRSRRSSP